MRDQIVGRNSANPADAPKTQRRIESMIDRYTTLIVRAQELAGRIENLTDRTIGGRPKKDEPPSVAPVPSGSLQQLDAIENQLSRTLEFIRDELQELEAAL